MPDALRLAIGTLTRIPVPAPGEVSRSSAGRAMCLAPALAAGLGLVCGLPLLLPGDGDAALLLAVIAIALLAWLTRGLHLDGLADLADALASGKPPAAALVIARKSDIGPFGVLVLVLSLLLQVAALAVCVDQGEGYLALVGTLVLSRVALTWACTRAWPAARPEGLGAMVAGTVPWLAALAWTLAALLGCSLLLGPAGGIASLIAVGAGLLVLLTARRRLGGVTGDVLGATIECAMTAGLVTLALTLPHLS